VQYFDPILLEGREWPPAEFEVTPELVKEIPRQVADLYGQMPELVDDDGSGLLEITRRVAELYESHENGNFETEALLAGNFPPLLLSCFATFKNWTELMGLVLLSGFCPCALAGLSLSTLLERNIPLPLRTDTAKKLYSGRYAKWLDPPEHPPAKWILEKVSRDPDPQLLRLDGLTLSKQTITLEGHRQLLQQSKIDIDTLPQKWIEYKDANIHGQLLQQLHREINILLINWIEYRDANGWQVLKGKNVIRLPPSEFVRFAEKIKFDIPWLGFAKAHFPHLLPEESTGRPTSATDTAISANVYRALRAERDKLEKCLENTKSELEKLRSEKGAIESERDSPWPWGDHETKLLRKLTDAAHEWWSTYDPEDTFTAPKNEEVSKWLEDHGVSKRVAEVMAQILRADGLPTGPRK